MECHCGINVWLGPVGLTAEGLCEGLARIEEPYGALDQPSQMPGDVGWEIGSSAGYLRPLSVIGTKSPRPLPQPARTTANAGCGPGGRPTGSVANKGSGGGWQEGIQEGEREGERGRGMEGQGAGIEVCAFFTIFFFFLQFRAIFRTLLRFFRSCFWLIHLACLLVALANVQLYDCAQILQNSNLQCCPGLQNDQMVPTCATGSCCNARLSMWKCRLLVCHTPFCCHQQYGITI